MLSQVSSITTPTSEYLVPSYVTTQDTLKTKQVRLSMYKCHSNQLVLHLLLEEKNIFGCQQNEVKTHSIK
jgi:hypothetical protein